MIEVTTTRTIAMTENYSHCPTCENTETTGHIEPYENLEPNILVIGYTCGAVQSDGTVCEARWEVVTQKLIRTIVQ